MASRYQVIFLTCLIANGHCAPVESARSLGKVAVGSPMFDVYSNVFNKDLGQCIQSQISILSHGEVRIKAGEANFPTQLVSAIYFC